MQLEQILAIVTPVLSGVGGIAMSLSIFASRTRKVVKISKEAMEDYKEIQTELSEAKKSIVELNQKISFLVEEAKERKRDAKIKQE